MDNRMKKNVLYDTYLSDVSPLGGVLILKEEGKKEYFSRTYQKGELCYEGHSFPADCISFGSGNIQITALYGDENEIRPFLNKLYERQYGRRVPLMFRKFFQYLYILSSLGIGFLTFLCLCRGQFGKFLLGFVILFILRLVYSESRNLIR